MNDSCVVANLKCGQHAGGVFDSLLSCDLPLVNQVSKKCSLYKLHNDEWDFTFVAELVLAYLFTSVVYTNDCWVSHPSACLGLLAEFFFKGFIIGKICLQQLDRNGSTQAGVGAFIHLCHPTSANQFA